MYYLLSACFTNGVIRMLCNGICILRSGTKTFILKFCVNVLIANIFQTIKWIWLIFGMVIDVASPFYSAMPPTMRMTLISRLWSQRIFHGDRTGACSGELCCLMTTAILRSIVYNEVIVYKRHVSLRLVVRM